MNSPRILLVEDDPVSLKLMRDVLRAGGYETAEATDGANALARAAAEAFDLIVLDLGLPTMSGLEVIRAIRRGGRTAATPIMVVTAYAMPGDEAAAREAGCSVYLTKPLQFAAFLSVVRDLLPGARGTAGQADASGMVK